MGHLDESNPTSNDLESENAATNNGSNGQLISLSSGSSSTSSDLSLQDLHILNGEHDENNNENLCDSEKPTMIQVMEHPETISSHDLSKKMFTGPGNWSMASNESLFSLRMDSTSFCHLDSFSPLFELPYNSVDGKILETDEETDQGSCILNEPAYKEDKENQLSATSSTRSSSTSSNFPILSGETEYDGSPNPHGSLIGPVSQSPPKPEPAPERGLQPKASEAETEAKETTTYIHWTKWFPCFRYCA